MKHSLKKNRKRVESPGVPTEDDWRDFSTGRTQLVVSSGLFLKSSKTTLSSSFRQCLNCCLPWSMSLKIKASSMLTRVSMEISWRNFRVSKPSMPHTLPLTIEISPVRWLRVLGYKFAIAPTTGFRRQVGAQSRGGVHKGRESLPPGDARCRRPGSAHQAQPAEPRHADPQVRW
jgi:hypothetical protein